MKIFQMIDLECASTSQPRLGCSMHISTHKSSKLEVSARDILIISLNSLGCATLSVAFVMYRMDSLSQSVVKNASL
jgi:hypothetical protein